MPKSRADYMRHRRGKVEEDPAVVEDPASNADRDSGLPRSNYSVDFTDVIFNMTQHARDAILEHPAIKTPRRS